MTGERRVLIEPGFWTRDACARVGDAMDRGSMEAAEFYDGQYIVADSVRRSFDVDVDPLTLDWIRRALIPARTLASAFFRVGLSHSEGAGLLRYPAGGFYRPHRDVMPGSAGQRQRRIAMVIFLNSAGEDEPFAGGELRLHGGDGGSGREAEPLEIVPRCGTLVAFPAARVHEVLPVTRGARDVVVDWFA